MKITSLVIGLLALIAIVAVMWGVSMTGNVTYLSQSQGANYCSDSNGDGEVDVVDLLTLVDQFGKSCNDNECASDAECPRISEEYCNANSACKKIAVYSCVNSKCVLGGVQDAASCNPCTTCSQGSCVSGVEEMFPLFTSGSPLFVNDPMNNVKTIITKTELPKLLAQGTFSGNVEATYQQTIIVGSNPKLIYAKQPTTANDPAFGYSLSTNHANYVYNATVTFNKAVDFTHADSKNQEIIMFGKRFTVGSGTDSSSLKLDWGSDRYELWAGSSVTKNGISIDGTLVTFTGNTASPSGLTGITISVAAADSDNDALMPRREFIDPVFGNFKLDFAQLNIDEYSDTMREEIKIFHSGDDKMYISMTDQYSNEKAIQFAGNFQGVSGAMGLIPDIYGHKIVVREGDFANKSDYVVIGNELEGHLLKVTRINNATTSYTSDEVSFVDVFSGYTYKAVLSSDGAGTLTVAGRSYDLKYFGAQTISEDSRTVSLNYPDSSPGSVVVYPTVQTSKGAKVAFYKPEYIYLGDDGFGNAITSLMIPNGNGYQINPTNGVGSWNGEIGTTGLIFNFNRVGNGLSIYLLNAAGEKITSPGLIIYEGKDDNSEYKAVVVTLEGAGTSADGVGVGEVIRTWNQDSVWNAITLASDSKKTKEADLWGTIALIDSIEPDQKTATISYPQEQTTALVYVVGTA